MTATQAPDAAAPDLETLAPRYTDWLRHALTISGPADVMARFRAAAAGPGIIPWQLDLDRMEEDWFLSLVAPGEDKSAISLTGARILARRLRDAAAANHLRNLARSAGDGRCPFDLQKLLPVPAHVLQLGPEDPRSRAWLWKHWGTTRPLRHTRLLSGKADGRSTRTGRMDLEFWSADWSPWQALIRLRKQWPGLIFDLRPDYQNAEASTGAVKGARRKQKKPAHVRSR